MTALLESNDFIGLQGSFCQFSQRAQAAPVYQWQITQTSSQGASSAQLSRDVQSGEFLDHFLQRLARRVLLIGKCKNRGIGHQENLQPWGILILPRKGQRKPQRRQATFAAIGRRMNNNQNILK